MSQSSNVTEVGAVFQRGQRGELFIFLAGPMEIHLRWPSNEQTPEFLARAVRLNPGDRVLVGYTDERQEGEHAPLEGVLHSIKGEVTQERMLYRLGEMPEQGCAEGAHFWDEEDDSVWFFPFKEYPWLVDQCTQQHLGQRMIVELINVDPERVSRAKLFDVSRPTEPTAD